MLLTDRQRSNTDGPRTAVMSPTLRGRRPSVAWRPACVLVCCLFPSSFALLRSACCAGLRWAARVLARLVPVTLVSISLIPSNQICPISIRCAPGSPAVIRFVSSQARGALLCLHCLHVFLYVPSQLHCSRRDR
jgi:hypothetical protein